MKSLALLAVALLMSYSDLAAQVEVEGLAPGTRVRVHAPEFAEKRMTARITFLDADSLVLTRRGVAERLVIPARAVERLEISHGRDHVAGLFRGTGLGALAGGLLLATATLVESTSAESGGDAGWTVLAVMAGMVWGAPVGAVVGGLIGVERWEHRPLWPRGVGPAPEGGVGLHASWRIP